MRCRKEQHANRDAGMVPQQRCKAEHLTKETDAFEVVFAYVTI
jgi:hypothetical protein